MLSVTKTNTVGDSRPLCCFGNIPLTIVSHTKSELGLTKQAMSPKFSSIVFLIFFLLSSLLYENSSTNLSYKSFLADINFGKDSILLSNNINYKSQNLILFIVASWI